MCELWAGVQLALVSVFIISCHIDSLDVVLTRSYKNNRTILNLCSEDPLAVIVRPSTLMSQYIFRNRSLLGFHNICRAIEICARHLFGMWEETASGLHLVTLCPTLTLILASSTSHRSVLIICCFSSASSVQLYSSGSNKAPRELCTEINVGKKRGFFKVWGVILFISLVKIPAPSQTNRIINTCMQQKPHFIQAPSLFLLHLFSHMACGKRRELVLIDFVW